MGFNLLLLWLYPTFIAPLFNQFKPLDDETLRTRVTALMQRCGFAAKGLFVMDGSRAARTPMPTSPVSVPPNGWCFTTPCWPSCLQARWTRCLAHELGHFKHKHIVKRILGMFAMSLVGFALLGWLSSQAWFYTGLGVMPNLDGTPNNALALLLFMLAIPVFSFFVSPLWAQLSRRHEFEADAYAVSQTSGHDLSTALLKLYEDNASTLTPDPLFVKFYYSHPPASERLARMTGKTLPA